jgi:hypothetical protein
MQECKRQTLELENRAIRLREKNFGDYTYGNNTYYDELELSMIFQSEVMRMSHRVTYNCFYAWQHDVFFGNVKPMAEKGFLYNLQSLLKNDYDMFNDLLEIGELAVDGFFNGKTLWNESNYIFIALQ